MFILLSNFGDESIALIQWAREKQLKNVTVVSFVTGWEAPEWNQRIAKGMNWVQSIGFNYHYIEPPLSFSELMHEQGKFPTRKFQWCANFLKGLPLLSWLDDIDSNCAATILIARRQASSRANFDLVEHIEEEEKLGDRALWHPLYKHTNNERDILIQQAGFDILNHRSLECDPCVNSDANDVLRMDLSTIERTAQLEQAMKAQLLDETIYDGLSDLLEIYKRRDKQEFTPSTGIADQNELFDMGCGNTYGCGL